jgi:hypothetical protein
MSYLRFYTLRSADVLWMVPMVVPLRVNTQLAPAGLVLTVISWLVPSNTVAQPEASGAARRAAALPHLAARRRMGRVGCVDWILRTPCIFVTAYNPEWFLPEPSGFGLQLYSDVLFERCQRDCT